jgi:hypothetical protein
MKWLKYMMVLFPVCAFGAVPVTRTINVNTNVALYGYSTNLFRSNSVALNAAVDHPTNFSMINVTNAATIGGGGSWSGTPVFPEGMTANDSFFGVDVYMQYFYANYCTVTNNLNVGGNVNVNTNLNANAVRATNDIYLVNPVWDDVRIPLASTRTGATAPAVQDFKDTVRNCRFLTALAQTTSMGCDCICIGELPTRLL